ncbi:MAG: hypothetical protein EON87_09925 [Brevundimonas sp.]|nr:MAG: hypothetical protein EON87_09925 [Brevundimonas sp.]
MTKQASPADVAKIFIWGGVGDIVIGLGLIVAALTGLMGPDMEILSIAGAVMAVFGVGIVLWGRNKLSQAEDRRGDMN